MPKTLGEKLRELRIAKGLTLEQLAELTGSSKSYIWDLENRSPPRPSAEKLSKIAVQLGMTIDYLLDEDDEVGIDEAADASFYRKYRKMDAPTKEKIRRMVDLWSDDEP